MMMNLFSLCDINLPLFLLIGWLLPFILGWLLGILRKGDEQKIVDLDDCIKAKNDLSNQLNALQSELENCKEERLDLDRQINTVTAQLSDANSKFNTLSLTVASIGSAPISGSKSKNIYASLSSSNLQIIEGIGPKMNELLHKNNINNWSDLANLTPIALRGILDVYGKKYRMIDPATWPDQAVMADNEKWEELISYQNDLSTGITSTTHLTASKLEKILIKSGTLRKFDLNDLKAIEGIGPKIEGLLHDSKIKTWNQLSEATQDKLNQILGAAGKRYALADPGTWPKQAALAANQKWDELRELQDHLKGGREV